MWSAYNKHDQDVLAWEVTKADGPFTCPECCSEVVIKKGQIKEHHFAHVPPFQCTYGTGESEEHKLAKLKIYDSLRPHSEVSKLQVERYLKDVRVRLDVSFCVRSQDAVTVEIQYSSLSPEEVARRTLLYTAKSIHVLWLLPHKDTLMEGEKYTTDLLERYLHALYFGRVYYWLNNDVVLPVHFDKYCHGSVYREWRDEEDQWHSGYIEQFAKYNRVPVFQSEARITDLQALFRKARRLGPYDLPKARLWGLPYDPQSAVTQH